MRRILAAAGLSVLCLQPAMAERQCTSLADQSAFEVEALRSELMVLAMSCNDDQQYNAFIHKFQPDLQANEKAIRAYFQHRYGRSAQTEQDRFVTDLANAMSTVGTSLGGDFCPRNGMMFNEVLSLASAAELPDYVAGKNLIPASISVCTPMSPPPKRMPVAKRATTAKK